MNKDIHNSEKILERFRFVEPIAPEVREHIRQTKAREFSKIMSSTGGSSLFFAAVTRLYFFLQSTGIGTTVTKSAVILIVAGVVFLSGITAGLIVSATSPSDPAPVKIIGREVKARLAYSPQLPGGKINRKVSAAVTGTSVRLFPVTGKGIPGDTLDAITVSLYNSFIKKNGRGSVSMKRRGSTSPWIIVGEVNQMDKTLAISLRLVNKSNGKIEAYGRERAESQEEIPAACEKLSSRISGHMIKLREAPK